MIEWLKHPKKPEQLEDSDEVAVLMIKWMERGVYGKDCVQWSRWGVDPEKLKRVEE